MLGSSSGFSSRLEGFRQGLRDLGWVEGQQIALEERYAENLDQLPDLAAELVRLPVALILAWGAANALAAQQATTRGEPHRNRLRRSSRGRTRAHRQTA